VIFAANLDYYHTLQGAWFRPIQSLPLTVELPAWLKVADVFEITPEGPRDVKWSGTRESLSIDAGYLTDVRIFVASAAHGLRSEIASRALRR